MSLKARAFKQGTRTGLCGPYAIVNALSQLGIGTWEPSDAARMSRDLASGLACGFAAVMREGTDRAQMEAMLAGAQAWTKRRGWPGWTWSPRHPQPQLAHADAFWGELGASLADGGTAAIIGFGDDDTGKPHFEPHWTCVERIGARSIHLFDSDEYDTIRRAETAVRPERGWEIEDCFVLAAEAAAA
jgi:hypothetical protein